MSERSQRACTRPCCRAAHASAAAHRFAAAFDKVAHTVAPPCSTCACLAWCRDQVLADYKKANRGELSVKAGQIVEVRHVNRVRARTVAGLGALREWLRLRSRRIQRVGVHTACMCLCVCV